ncbi:hypothetical protein D3C85_1417800 [compost metagenome]
MHSMPARISARGPISRARGTAPLSLRPYRVMVSGSTPTINDAGATPRRWIAATRHTKYTRLPITARRNSIHASAEVS